MKKRILSFLMACFMVVSTFIISKPLVHVHAVEDEQTFVEGENQWTLPNYFEEYKEDGAYVAGNSGVNGNWSIRAYDNMTDRNVLKPTSANGNTNPNDSTYKDDLFFYANYDNKWYGNIDTRELPEGAKYSVMPHNFALAIVFTAPEDGIYYFDEDVFQNRFLIWDGSTRTFCAVRFSVYKGADRYACFSPSGTKPRLDPAAEDVVDTENEYGELTGYVALEAGEELIFSYEWAYHYNSDRVYGVPQFYVNADMEAQLKADGAPFGACVEDIVVTKAADLPENYEETVYEMDFADITGSGVFNLYGYDYSAKKPLATSTWSIKDASYIYSPTVGAIGFKAPADGYYAIDVDGGQTYVDRGANNYKALTIVAPNGEVIANASVSKLYMYWVAFQKTELNVAGVVYLEAGEEVYIVGRPADYSATTHNVTVDGVTVTKLGYNVEQPEVVTEWELPLEFTSLQNSYFKIKAVNPATGEYYSNIVWTDNCIDYAGNPADYKWEVLASEGKLPQVYFVYADGTKTYTGGATHVPVVEFTAPADGTYTFDIELYKYYGGVRTELVQLIKGNEFVIFDIAGLSAKGVYGKELLASHRTTKDKETTKLVATAELKAGETVSFIRSFAADCTNAGASANAINYFKVTSTNVVCPHNWTDASGVCACGYACEHAEYAEGSCVVCGVAHAEHDWSNSDGYCATCGLGHEHEGGEAVCNKGAICTICGYEYTEADADNHDWSDKTGVCGNCGEGCTHAWENGVCTTCGYECVHDNFGAVTNGDGTHDYVCNICGSAFITGATCKPVPEGTECECGYDCSAMIAEDNFGEVFDSIYNGGESEYVANGPAAGALDNVGAVKGTDVDGFKYMGFNLEMNADKNTFYLRHHVLLSGDLAVKVGEADAALTFVSGNYCYFDVEVKIGEFGVNHTITADGTAVVTASVYSYMKTALESGELTTEQTNLLKALYDWDYAVANAD